MRAAALLGSNMPAGESVCVQLTWGKWQWTHKAQPPDAARVCAWAAELVRADGADKSAGWLRQESTTEPVLMARADEIDGAAAA